MGSLFLSLLYSLVLCHLSANADIYGTDDRTQVYLEENEKGVGGSVAVGVINSLWEEKDKDFVELALIDESISGMCEDEKFSKDPSVSYACTGFLIGPDLLVTAGHCSVNFGEVFNESEMYCDAYTWLFDYQFKRNGEINLDKIPKDNVYNCKEIIYAVYEDEIDFSIIRLDRPVKGRKFLSLAEKESLLNESINALGFPAGQPLKKAPGKIVSVDKDHYIIDSDAMSGNSGSPVLNENNEVIGVLIGGRPNATFYTDKKNRCERFNYCDENGQNCMEGNEENKGFPYAGIQVFKFNEYFDLQKIIEDGVVNINGSRRESRSRTHYPPFL